MTNLSDLFPAGAGKQVSFTASGAISAAGKPVILNSAGTVTQVGLTAASSVGAGTPVVFSASTALDECVTFDSTNNKIVIGFRVLSTGYGIVGTVSGTSISYGSATPLTSNVNIREASMAYDSTNNKVVMSYRSNDDDYGYAAVGTITGTSISWGTSVAFASAKSEHTSCVYDSSNSKIVIAFNDGANSQYGTAIVGTVSGTTISFGTEVVFNSGESSKISQAYDSTNNKIVMSCMDDDNSGRGNAVVGTVSGTSISFGTNVFFTTGRASDISSTFDTVANKVVISYYTDGGGLADHGACIVGTVSGTSISFGTQAVFNSASTKETACSYDTGADRTVISFKNDSPASGKAIAGTVSGTSISYNTVSQFVAAAPGFMRSAYDSSAGKVVTVYQLSSGSGYGVILSASSSNLTAANFIGISDAAILDTASGNVTIKGGIATTGLTSLTPGSDYYAQDDGSITTSSAGVKIGKAMSATAINLEYQS